MFEFGLLLVLLLIVSNIVIYSMVLGISPMPSSKKVANEILIELKTSEEETIIDLGSGFGSLAIFLASNLPHKKVIGYELSIFPFLVSLFLKRILNIKNLEIYRKDFLEQDLKNCVLVCYLFPTAMEKLENKIFEETINTKIISSTFAFRNIKHRDLINANDLFKTPIFIYKT